MPISTLTGVFATGLSSSSVTVPLIVVFCPALASVVSIDMVGVCFTTSNSASSLASSYNSESAISTVMLFVPPISVGIFNVNLPSSSVVTGYSTPFTITVMSSFATGTSVLLLFVIVPVMVTLLPTFTGSISSISMLTSALTTSNSSTSEL